MKIIIKVGKVGNTFKFQHSDPTCFQEVSSRRIKYVLSTFFITRYERQLQLLSSSHLLRNLPCCNLKLSVFGWFGLAQTTDYSSPVSEGYSSAFYSKTKVHCTFQILSGRTVLNQLLIYISDLSHPTKYFSSLSLF